MKTPIPLFLIIFSITGVAFLSKSQAVVPPPDGGYAGGNTGEGNSALLGLTTGTYNTAVGIYSVLSLTDGSFCTGIGAGTLLANTANENTATGAGALLGNTTIPPQAVTLPMERLPFLATLLARLTQPWALVLSLTMWTATLTRPSVSKRFLPT